MEVVQWPMFTGGSRTVVRFTDVHHRPPRTNLRPPSATDIRTSRVAANKTYEMKKQQSIKSQFLVTAVFANSFEKTQGWSTRNMFWDSNSNPFIRRCTSNLKIAPILLVEKNTSIIKNMTQKQILKLINDTRNGTNFLTHFIVEEW